MILNECVSSHVSMHSGTPGIILIYVYWLRLIIDASFYSQKKSQFE